MRKEYTTSGGLSDHLSEAVPVLSEAEALSVFQFQFVKVRKFPVVKALVDTSAEAG